MRDDELLQRLAELARQEEDEATGRLDPRWDALAAGTLAPAEAEALRKEAAGAPEKAAAYEAFTPLGEEFRGRVVEAVRGGLTAAEESPTDWVGSPQPAAPPTPLRKLRRLSPPASRIDRQDGRRRAWMGGAVAAALAAAVVLVVLRPWTGPEPLPAYTGHLAGRTQEWRAGEGEQTQPGAPLFAPGNRLELVLSPEESVAKPPVVKTFLAHGGELAPWPIPFEVSGHGAVRLAGTVGEDVRLPPGQSTLVVAIGRPGSLPTAAALQARLAERGGARDSGCRLLTREALLCTFAVAFRMEP
jgi:hypothetical protein